MSNLSLTQSTNLLLNRAPSDLSGPELGAVLDVAARLDSFIQLARDEAEKRLKAKTEVDGWELAPTTGKRFVLDPVLAGRQLHPLLTQDEILACCTVGVGKATEAIKNREQCTEAEAKDILADYLKGNLLKGPGGTKLVPKAKVVEVKEIQ